LSCTSFLSSSSLRCTYLLFNAPSPTVIYTLSLHDALPIWGRVPKRIGWSRPTRSCPGRVTAASARPATAHPHPAASMPDSRRGRDRKSTRLNSSHVKISYAVFCLKKKKQTSARAHLYTKHR